MDSLAKKYYKISEVAEIVELPISTLRFWEKKFTIIKPRRNSGNTRFYTADDIEKIRMITYLVKEKGLHLEAAQAQLANNPDGITRRYEVVSRLRKIRSRLEQINISLLSMKE